MHFPILFNLAFLPFLIIFAVLFWNGSLLTGFFAYFPKVRIHSKVYLLAGLTSISFAVFTLGSGLILVSSDKKLILFAGFIKFISVIPLSTFLFLLSASYLNLKNFYWWKAFPLLSLLCLIFFLIFPEKIVNFQTIPQHSSLLANFFPQYIPKIGKEFSFYIGIIILNILIMGVYWVLYFIKQKRDLWLMISFLAIIVFGTLEAGHDLGLYCIPPLFIVVMTIIIMVISYKLFQNAMKINQEFLKKSQELRKVNDEMKFLVRTLSHDIMGPLVAIHGFADLMEEGQRGNDSKQEHYLERIWVNADQMKTLLNNLADYIRIGRVEESLEFIDFPNLIHQAIAILNVSRQYPDATIEIAGQWPQKFYGSSLRLKQIFLNLIENSLRHGKKSNIHISIGGILGPKDFIFFVQDNGAGIPVGFQKNVFNISFQREQGKQKTGMGLPIIRKIVENFHGKIWIDSSYNLGMRVYISFPYQTPSLFSKGMID